MTLFAIFVLLVVAFKLPETRPKNTETSDALYHWNCFKPVLNDRHFMFYAAVCMVGMASILTYTNSINYMILLYEEKSIRTRRSID
jgi:DHA1 family bicyclomycin/chloramphenicol resistance-like MFS transporter